MEGWKNKPRRGVLPAHQRALGGTRQRAAGSRLRKPGQAGGAAGGMARPGGRDGPATTGRCGARRKTGWPAG